MFTYKSVFKWNNRFNVKNKNEQKSDVNIKRKEKKEKEDEKNDSTLFGAAVN